MTKPKQKKEAKTPPKAAKNYLKWSMRLGITGFGIVQAGEDVTEEAAKALESRGLDISKYTH